MHSHRTAPQPGPLPLQTLRFTLGSCAFPLKSKYVRHRLLKTRTGTKESLTNLYLCEWALHQILTAGSQFSHPEVPRPPWPRGTRPGGSGGPRAGRGGALCGGAAAAGGFGEGAAMAAGRPVRGGGSREPLLPSAGSERGPSRCEGTGPRPEPCEGREPRALLRCLALGGGG